MDDVCIIAAPRPLRLFPPSHQYHHTHHTHQHHVVVPRPRPIFAPPVDAFAKFSLDDSTTTTTSPEEDDTASPPTSDDPESATSSDESSTRLSLPEEALEEFLAILRPSASVPPFRFNHHRRHAAGGSGGSAGASAPYERPHPYRYRKSVSTVSSATEDTSDKDRRSRRGVEKFFSRGGRSEVDTPLTISDELIQVEWRNFELGSPISRNQTRNPLPRHPSFDNLLVAMPVSPFLRPSRNPMESVMQQQQQQQHPQPTSSSEGTVFTPTSSEDPDP